MRALHLDRGTLRLLADAPAAEPRPGEVPVRVLRAGICETDLQLVRGYMGFSGVPGHEFVGVAESGRFRGRRVVGEINCSCGGCEDCASGRRNHCPHRSVLGILGHDGAFAEVVCVPEENLHAVPDGLPDERAVFVEPVAAAFQVPAQVPLDGRRVIVLGDGRLGNLCAQVAARAGGSTLVVGRHRRKLDLIADLGIETAFLGELDVGRRADVVIDCTGSPAGLPLALQLVRPRGTIVLKTTVAGEQTLSMAPFVIDEIELVGSRCGPFETALAALARGDIEVERLIDSTFPLSEGVAAVERAGAPGVLKVLLDPSA